MLADDKTVGASVTDADRLNLWLTAVEALYTPMNDEHLKRFRFEGSDGLVDQVGEVLRYDSPDRDELLITFHPQSFLPMRVRWRPVDGPKAARTIVELELSDFRPVEGTMWPHKFIVFANGMPAWFEAFDRIAVGEPK
jgi:hypothetical protein